MLSSRVCVIKDAAFFDGWQQRWRGTIKEEGVVEIFEEEGEGAVMVDEVSVKGVKKSQRIVSDVEKQIVGVGSVLKVHMVWRGWSY